MGFWLGVAVLFVIYLLILLAWRIAFFLDADADLTLLFQKKIPPNAFEDKVVWITGASQGIGQELAQRFASLGARLILSARSIERLEAVKATCTGKHAPDRIVLLPFDLTAGSTGLKEAVGEAMCAFGALLPEGEEGYEEGEWEDRDTPGGVDILVLNAAAPRTKMPCEEMDFDTMQNMFNVNVLGTIELARHLVPCMIAHGGGQIVVVSSAAGKMPSPTQATYAATKHAVNGYFASMRSELACRGIQVTLACPGPIATDDPLPLPVSTPPSVTAGSRTSTASSSSTGNASNAAEGSSPAASGNGGAEEQTGEVKAQQENRMTVSRCAELVVTAVAHQLPEAWISKQPVLAAFYACQYFPEIAIQLFNKIGASRVTALKEGSSDLYSSNLLFKKEN